MMFSIIKASPVSRTSKPPHSIEIEVGANSNSKVLVLHLILVALLGVSIFFAKAGYFSPDAARYQSFAFNIAQGKGYTTYYGEPVVDRGPVFPVSLALVMVTLGNSMEQGLIVPHLYWLLNLLVIYFLGRSFHSALAGLLGAIIASSVFFLFDFFNLLLLDGVLTFYMNLGLLLMLMGFSRQKLAYFAWAGIVLSLGYLTKPSAVTWLALPPLIVLFFAEQRKIQNVVGLFLYGAGFLLLNSLWLMYWWFVKGEIYLIYFLQLRTPVVPLLMFLAALVILVGSSFPAKSGQLLRHLNRFKPTGIALFISRVRSGVNEAVINGLSIGLGIALLMGIELVFIARLYDGTGTFSSNLVAMVQQYVTVVIVPALDYVPFVLLGWLIVIYRALRRQFFDQVLLLAVLLFVPILIMISRINAASDVRNLLPLIFLSYLNIGRLSADLVAKLGDVIVKGGGPKLAPSWQYGLFIVVLILGFGFAGYRQFDFVQATYWRQNLPGSWGEEPVKSVGYWLVKNIPPGAIVGLIERSWWEESYYVFTDAKLPIQRVSLAAHSQLDLSRANLFTSESVWGQAGLFAPTENVLYVETDQNSGDTLFNVITEEMLINAVQKQSIDYLIISDIPGGFRYSILLDYLSQSSAFEEVFSSQIGGQVHIFKIYRECLSSSNKLYNYPTMMNVDTLFDILKVARQKEQYVDDGQVLRHLGEIKLADVSDKLIKAHAFIGDTYFASGDNERAFYAYQKLLEVSGGEQIYSEKISLFKDTAFFYFMQAALSQYNNFAEKALLQYKQAIETDPASAIFYIGLGNYYLGADKLDEADAIFSQAELVDPNQSDVLIGLGKVEMAKGNWDRADTFYNRAFQLNPRQSFEINWQLSMLKRLTTSYIVNDLPMQSDFAMCPVRTARSSHLAPDQKTEILVLNSYIAQAVLYQSIGRLDRSLEAYKNVFSSIRFVFPRPYQKLANAYADKAQVTLNPKFSDKELQMYDLAWRSPDDRGKMRKTLNEGVPLLGVEFFDQELSSELEDLYLEPITLNPNNYFAYDELGNIYSRIHQFNKASSIYSKVIERWPNNKNAYINLGRTLMTQGKQSEAASVFQIALAHDPQNQRLYLDLSHIFQAQGFASKSEELLRSASQQDLLKAWPHLELGQLYLEQAMHDASN